MTKKDYTKEPIELTDGVKGPFSKGKKRVTPTRKGTNKIYSSRNKWTKIPFVTGYDLLQYMIAVRPYIEKKYSISTNALEYLLYLFPFQYFTIKEYNKIPKYGITNYISLKQMREDGWLETVLQPRKGSSVLGFTPSAVDCVRDFYKYLSGQKKISHKPILSNPFVLDEQQKLNQMRWKLMLELREGAEKRPSKYRKALFQPVPPHELAEQD